MTLPLTVGLGELLWDRLPDRDRLGGAPFNVVCHLARLRHRAVFVTAVGCDDLGDAALRELRHRGVDDSFVTRSTRGPTGIARVTLAAAGAPTFEIVRPAAYESLRLDAGTVAGLTELAPDALVIGTLAHAETDLLGRTRELVARLGDATVVYDVNLRAGSWSIDLVRELAALATVVKLNDDEARELAPALGYPGGRDMKSFCRKFARRFELRGVAVTAGQANAALLLDGMFTTTTPPRVDVVDTIGAGDAFTAALVDGLVHDRSVEATLQSATALGALVASRHGALPEWTPSELARYGISATPLSRSSS
jgi:fructokinase